MAKHRIDRRQLAAAIGVDIMRIYRILDDRMAVSADTAVRLGHFFENGAHFWMHQQAAYELAQQPVSEIARSVMRVSDQRWQTLPRQRRKRSA